MTLTHQFTDTKATITEQKILTISKYPDDFDSSSRHKATPACRRNGNDLQFGGKS